jgi:hypothetical protein
MPSSSGSEASRLSTAEFNSVNARQAIAIILLLIPIFFVLLWHLGNHALPTDDAADHAVTALRIATQFGQHGALAGATALLGIRGWRPVAFPPLAVPFFLLSGNDVVAGCAATLLLIYVALTFYLYRLARLCSTDPLVAGAACAAVLSMPTIAWYSLEFFSEAAWMLVSVACFYHIASSGPFRYRMHSVAAGLFAGLMVDIRPVESVIALIVLLAFLIVTGIQSEQLSVGGVLTVVGVFFCPALLLVLSAWVKPITRSPILAVCFVAVCIGVLLGWRYNPSFVAFFGALVSVSCLWWAGYMPALFDWAHDAWTFAKMSHVTDMGALGHVRRALQGQFADYGKVQMFFLGGLVLFLAVSAVMSAKRRRTGQAAWQQVPAQARLLLYVSSILLVFSVIFYSSGGSDRRRSLVALIWFAISVTVIAGARSRLALAAVFCLIGVQFTVLGSAVAGTPRWAALNGFGIPAPHRNPDGNFEMARALARYVMPASAVAVYTAALSRADARVFEPAALELASLSINGGFDVTYLWNASDYSDVIARLQHANVKYLLLDSLPEPAVDANTMPYERFTAELLRRIQDGSLDTPGLRVIARFQVQNRDQILFRILPPSQNNNNLAAEFNGSRAIASGYQKGFPVFNLNDGTEAAWGSLEGTTDVYAGVILPSPQAIQEVRLKLFSPGGRAHLRNIRMVSADREGPQGPDWQSLRARLKGGTTFADVVTVPPLPDDSVVTIEIDRSDPQWHSRPIWGFACRRSKGDLPNYLSGGTGVYLRELEIQRADQAPLRRQP